MTSDLRFQIPFGTTGHLLRSRVLAFEEGSISKLRSLVRWSLVKVLALEEGRSVDGNHGEGSPREKISLSRMRILSFPMPYALCPISLFP
ncbi:hypothetical protein [Scytonema sp. NUACC26]|uniref:hypothetical protein n=1 Tax=Scytonema sp. NUACC26 TaxID=3140176 RepID=UPI0038B37166